MDRNHSIDHENSALRKAENLMDRLPARVNCHLLAIMEDLG